MTIFDLDIKNEMELLYFKQKSFQSIQQQRQSEVKLRLLR